MKKVVRFLSIILVLILSLVLFACHGKNNFNKNIFIVPDNFDETQEIELTFWAKNDSFIEQKVAYNDAIARFQEYYPNIKITIKNYSDYTLIYNDVITNIATNTTPNICITYPDYVATYLEGDNIVIDLDNLMNDSKYGFGGSEIKYQSITKESVISKFLDELIINGQQYAIPFMRSSEATYVNKDYVEKLGFTLPEVLTWDFVWEVSEKAMEEYGKEPNTKFKPLIYKSTDNMFIQMAKQRNIAYTNTDGDILLFNDDTKELLSELQDKVTLGLFDVFKHSGYPGNFFNRGNCIFAIDSTAGATWMGAYAPNVDIPEDQRAIFETVVYTVPQTDANNIQMISQGPSICVFNKEDPQIVLASWLFAQFLLNDETQVAYAKTEGYIPVTYSAINSTEYQNYINNPVAMPDKTNSVQYKIKIDASKSVYENINNTFITPVFNGSSLVRTASGVLIDTTVQDVFKKINGKAEGYFDNMFSNTATLYKLKESDTSSGLGPLPKESKILLISLGVVWLGIGTIFGIKYYKKIKSKKNE